MLHVTFAELTRGVANEKEVHWLLVIDHHEARIFHSEMDGAIPQQILPHEPEDHFRHAHNSKDFSRGREKPDPNSFFEPVAQVLQATGQLLIFGTGTGTSSEMDQFIAWLKLHHPEVARRIIGSLIVDEHHLTEGQLPAKAREFYANAGMDHGRRASWPLNSRTTTKHWAWLKLSPQLRPAMLALARTVRERHR